MTAGGPVKRVLVLAEAQKLLETDTGEGRVLRAVAQVRCRAADYWGSRCAGMCSENRWTQAAEATKDVPHGLDQGSCSTSAQASKRLIARSTIHPPTDQGFARSCSQAAATGRARRRRQAGLGERWDWEHWRRRRGRRLVHGARGQQRTCSDLLVPERRWADATVAPSLCTASSFFISCAHTPRRTSPNLPSAADAARLARPRLETVQQQPSSQIRCAAARRV